MAASSSSSPAGKTPWGVTLDMPEWGKEYADAAMSDPNKNVVRIYKEIVGQSGGFIGKEELRVLQEIKNRVTEKGVRGLSSEVKKCLGVIEKCELFEKTLSKKGNGAIKPPNLDSLFGFSGPKFVPSRTVQQQRELKHALGSSVAGSSSQVHDVEIDDSDFMGIEEAEEQLAQGKKDFVKLLNENLELKYTTAYSHKKNDYEKVKDLVVDPNKPGFNRKNYTLVSEAIKPLRDSIVQIVVNTNELEKMEKYCPPEKLSGFKNVKLVLNLLIMEYYTLHPDVRAANSVRHQLWTDLQECHEQLSTKEISDLDATDELKNVLRAARVLRWKNDSDEPTLGDEAIILDCVIDHCERELAKEVTPSEEGTRTFERLKREYDGLYRAAARGTDRNLSALYQTQEKAGGAASRERLRTELNEQIIKTVPLILKCGEIEALERSCPENRRGFLEGVRENLHTLTQGYCELRKGSDILEKGNVRPFTNKLIRNYNALNIVGISTEDRIAALRRFISNAKKLRDFNSHFEKEAFVGENKVLSCVIWHYEREFAKLSAL